MRGCTALAKEIGRLEERRGRGERRLEVMIIGGVLVDDGRRHVTGPSAARDMGKKAL